MSDAPGGAGILNQWIEDQEGKVYPLQFPFSVGRSPDNAYVIASERVSRRHALVQMRSEGEFWLTDLGSRNGVFLNRQPLQHSARLKAGDVFQIADRQFIFHMQDLQEVTSHLDTAHDVTVVEQQTVKSWIFIADIISSVRQAQEHDPTAWTAKVGAWIADCRAILNNKGGTMNKFLGDGFLAFWNGDVARPEDVALGLREMTMLQAGSPLPFRFVVHYGPVQFVSIARGEISLTGNAVNFTFRLEKVASGLDRIAVATRPAFDACQGLPGWESVGSHAVPSFSEPVELFTPSLPATDGP
jgi:class 3 adenylate cyclase